MNQRKLFFNLTIGLMLTATVARAQDTQNPRDVRQAQAGSDTVNRTDQKHEYSVYLAGGASDFFVTLRQSGKTNGGFGFGGGLAYTYNLNENWGLSAGIEISKFYGKTSFKKLEEEYEAYDNHSNHPGALRYKYSITGYEERQDLAMLSIPLKARFKMPVGGITDFYAAGGFKLGFPVGAKAKITGGSLVSSGYYLYEQVTYVDLPEYGFFNGQGSGSQESKIDFGIATMLSLEAGLRFSVGKTVVFSGLFFDYCLNDMQKSSDKHPLQYDGTVRYESAFNSSLANKLKPLSLGLKAGIAF
jgi:hypothetical protein